MDAATYKNLMRQQAGGVALIATGRPGNRTGLTATAVCSVTADPPTLMVCVNQSASAHKVITETGSYSVNLLSAEHQELAGVFSGQTELQGEARFDNSLWQTRATGAPVLKDALASFDCEVTAQQVVSTHTIFIGEVRDGAAREAGEPMIYFHGAFRKLA